MTTLLTDTNIVSIRFRRGHPLQDKCELLVGGHELAISFMTLAELHLWPRRNGWGEERRTSLRRHLESYVTLLPDETTCELWSEISDECFAVGRPISPADAWIAATARQWSLTLVTPITGTSRPFPA